MPPSSSRLLFPVLCAILPLLAGRLSWLSFACAAVLAILVAWRLRPAPPASVREEPLAPAVAVVEEPPPPRTEALLRAVAPAWSRNVELARTQTEHAAQDLALRFGQMHATIASESDVGRDSAGRKVLDTLRRAQDDLPRALESLHQSHSTRTAFLERIRDVGESVGNLNQLADAVGKVASQTNLLALNAAIEAARSGEAGRGFAVVADEVRQLSKSSSSTGAEIRAKVEGIDRGVKEALSGAGALSEQERGLLENVERAVTGVLAEIAEQVASLERQLSTVQARSREVGDAIQQVLIDLQFQDRTSQILASVRDDIDRLLAALASGEDLGDPEPWLRRLEASYTTDEQSHATVGGQPATSSVTFF